MKMNLHCFANLIPIMILALFSNSGLINATEVGKRTDALEASAWNESKWISAVDAPIVKGHNNGRAADGASWFVSTVKNEQKIVSAKWMTAGLGVYELYVNGKPVGGEFLKPGFTHYAKTKRSFTYDITDIIRTKPNAENMLSVQVTPGWWGDKIITPGGYDGMIGKKCAFRGVLELTFSDGSKKRYGTDLENWKAGIAGPVKHAGIFDGEEYDAREHDIRFVEHTDFTEEIIADADILYMTRVQRERFTDLMEYERVKNVYILRNKMLENTRPNLRILHPLPRVNEIAYDVDNNPKAYYFQQAQNGLYAREAILCDVLGITLEDVKNDILL